MNLIFLDTVGWDYDVATPFERPLGGSQSAFCYLAVALAQRGHQVTLASGTSRPRQVLGVRCLSCEQLPLTVFAAQCDAVILLNAGADLCLRLRPHMDPAALLILWTQHAFDQPAMVPLQRAEVRAGWDLIVCVSDWHRATMIEHYALDPAGVLVLRNAIAPAFEGLFQDDSELIRAKAPQPILSYTSTPFRGLDVLLSIFPEVRRATPDAALLVYSSMKVYHQDEEGDAYAPLYERCRSTPGVTYVGSVPQPQLAGALRGAAILAYPNTFAETSCIAVIEAMAAGLFIVTSDLGALPETTMGFGALVPGLDPTGSVAAFANGYLARLREVLQERARDPNAFAAARFEQVKAINERCTWRVRARQWEEVIQESRQRRAASRGTVLPSNAEGTGTSGRGETLPSRISIAQALALAHQYIQARRLPEVETLCRQILHVSPGEAEAYRLMGIVADHSGNHAAALWYLQQAITLNPQFAEYADNLSWLLHRQGRFAEAAAMARQALSISPLQYSAHTNLGNALLGQGQVEEARMHYVRALELMPTSAVVHSAFLRCEQYRPGVTLADLEAAHREWDRRHAQPLIHTWRPFANQRDPERRLRLGFVSADFRSHPVGIFLLPVLEALDAQQCATICYADSVVKDELSHRIAAAAGLWREIGSLSDEALAEQIRADGIDILFDLPGHTGNRLLAFARKPAPVQITWAGYVGTTGLAAMDYLLADRFHVPEGVEGHYREKILRLPDGYICYRPPTPAPEVGPLPAIALGHVTFGSFNSPAKVTPQVVAAWAQILQHVPRSRLVLKYAAFDEEEVRRRYTEQFASQGVAPERLDLQGWSPRGELMAHYQGIDLALDPFPYSGGLTTCEALWMGVPVVTCPGETFASRHSLSHLSNVGLPEMAAADLADYVERAAGLAHDLPRLATLRRSLRGRMLESPHCDAARFASHLLAALRVAWRQWCASPS